MSILGDRIKKERENLNLTREELAKKIGVSYSAIAMYEQGNREPNNELTIKMCELFNCTMDYLIGLTNIREPIDGLKMDKMNEKTKKNLYGIYEYIEKHKKIDEQMNRYYMCPVYRRNISRTT